MRAFIVFSLFAVVNADVGGYTYGIAPNGGYFAGGSNGAESIRSEAISGVNGGPATGGIFNGSFGTQADDSTSSLAAPSSDSFRNSFGGSAGGFLAAPSSDSFRGSFGSSAGGSLAAPSSDAFRGSFGNSAGGSLAAPSSDAFRGSLDASAARDVDASFGAASNSAPLIDNGFNKEFFTFSAPESEFEASTPIGEVAQSLKKNLRVIFIRSPENHGINNAAINLAKQATKEKTAIYVLTKQPDVSELANRLQQINSNINNKPEVHFVKYRTPEDAANAQHAIQQQYDNLGGSSHLHDGGVAHVLNFASKGSAYPAYSGNDAGSFGAATSNSYIPPASHVASGSSPSATYLPIAKV